MVNLYDPKSGNIDKSRYIALLALGGNAIKGNFVLNYHMPYWVVLILLVVSITLVFSLLHYLLPLAYSQKLHHISSWVEFGIAETELSLPSGIAIDPSSGNVYVADTGNNRIQVFSNDGTYVSKWGEYREVSRNGTLKFPQRIALDEQGNVYVADTGNNRIQVFSNNGTYVSKWGRYGIGNGSFNQPSGIAIDPSSGNVYVADTGNNRIQVFSNDGTYVSKWGEFGRSEVGVRLPADIVIQSSSDNILITDTGNGRILVFHSNSAISDEAFPSEEEEEISSNDSTGNQTAFSGFL
jgi:tripartite motif-containing protein 71